MCPASAILLESVGSESFRQFRLTISERELVVTTLFGGNAACGEGELVVGCWRMHDTGQVIVKAVLSKFPVVLAKLTGLVQCG